MLHDGLTLYEEDIVVVLPSFRALMPVEAGAQTRRTRRISRGDGKGTRALKELDTVRVVLEALGSVTLWSSPVDPNLTQGGNIAVVLAARLDCRRPISYVA